MSNAIYDPAQRAAEKQASRVEDARALASGEKSREQLRRENQFTIRGARMLLSEAKRLY